jgi:hypothetical protein
MITVSMGEDGPDLELIEELVATGPAQGHMWPDAMLTELSGR